MWYTCLPSPMCFSSQPRNCPMRRVRLSVELLEERCVPSSARFVTSLYTHLLHRNPGISEVAYWVGALAAGASPRLVTLGFLTCAEYRIGLVRATYQHLLLREPDAPSLPARVASLQAGANPEEMTA